MTCESQKKKGPVYELDMYAVQDKVTMYFNGHQASNHIRNEISDDAWFAFIVQYRIRLENASKESCSATVKHNQIKPKCSAGLRLDKYFRYKIHFIF